MGAASAKIAAHTLTHRVVAKRETVNQEIVGDVARHPVGGFGDHRYHRANLAWGAIPELKLIKVNERLQNGMQISCSYNTRNGRVLLPVVLNRECEARQDPLATGQYRARPT